MAHNHVPGSISYSDQGQRESKINISGKPLKLGVPFVSAFYYAEQHLFEESVGVILLEGRQSICPLPCCLCIRMSTETQY